MTGVQTCALPISGLLSTAGDGGGANSIGRGQLCGCDRDVRFVNDAGVRRPRGPHLAGRCSGHQILLANGLVIVEELSLVGFKAGTYDYMVLPIAVAGHDGAPARAIPRRREP